MPAQSSPNAATVVQAKQCGTVQPPSVEGKEGQDHRRVYPGMTGALGGDDTKKAPPTMGQGLKVGSQSLRGSLPGGANRQRRGQAPPDIARSHARRRSARGEGEGAIAEGRD